MSFLASWPTLFDLGFHLPSAPLVVPVPEEEEAVKEGETDTHLEQREQPVKRHMFTVHDIMIIPSTNGRNGVLRRQRLSLGN